MESAKPQSEREVWFLAGLFLTTLGTLALEILDTRLLSVLTWYHLSFFAVSTAMFGMSAGAVHVYLGGDRFSAASAPSALAHVAFLFALAVPSTHLFNLIIPLATASSLVVATGWVCSTVLLALPFYLSGIIVAVSLTRIARRVGLVYATDLVGAALGSIVVIPLLQALDISSAAFAVGAVCALGAVCFARYAGTTGMLRPALVAGLLIVAALLNGATKHGFRVTYWKGVYIPSRTISFEAWNTFSQVIALVPDERTPFYWGARKDADSRHVVVIPMAIDGLAGTAATQWDGSIASLDWVQHDVTSLPYHLRKHGDVAIIGVGGGRDVLTALWAKSRSITGIEMNGVFLRLLEGQLRTFSGLIERPEVHFVHDEARSFLTRTTARFDVLQMSLIDTWAATGAGAFTLSENGLYTLEGWRVFLEALKPEGVLSVSRWFLPSKVSETSRMAALAMAVLLERGIVDPSRNLALISCGEVATLLLSKAPFSESDLDAMEESAKAEEFEILVSPRKMAEDKALGAIFGSHSLSELAAATQDARFDYSPPTDERPYFFNMLRPRGLLHLRSEDLGVSTQGNLLATLTLVMLAAVSLILVAAVIVWPLWRGGVPRMPKRTFAMALLYFALIGIGFMMVQIPYMQRFSVYLGHPTYAIAVILFSMILATGIGSWISDHLPVETSRGWVVGLPLLAAALLVGAIGLMQPAIDATVRYGIEVRCAIVCALVAPPSLILGCFFPIGMRLLRPLGESPMPWMWGVNGACSVLASVLAVFTSMWGGIDLSLYLAVVCYAVLPLPAWALASSRS